MLDAPKIEVGEVRVNHQYDDYEPTFKTFAEAEDWAADTVRLGDIQFFPGPDGKIASCTHPDGLAHLGEAFKASHDAQERGQTRAAAYLEEAEF